MLRNIKYNMGGLCFCNNTKIALTELIGGIRKRFGKLQGEPETKETIKKSEEISFFLSFYFIMGGSAQFYIIYFLEYGIEIGLFVILKMKQAGRHYSFIFLIFIANVCPSWSDIEFFERKPNWLILYLQDFCQDL